MLSRLWQQYKLFVTGIIVVTAATATLLLFARDDRFVAGGLAINPEARIDPERTYKLIVWEEEIVIPWAAKSHPEMLLDAIRMFQAQRPNVAVMYVMMDPEEARQKLAQALAVGVPPDVYGSAQGVLFDSTYQVPASPYLPAPALAPTEGPPLFLPAALSMLQADGVLWGWPKALWWQTWLGRTEAEPLTITSPVASAGSITDAAAVALNVLDIILLEQWMAAAGAPFYINTAGELMWTEALLARVAGTLRTLQIAGALPKAANTAKTARTRVEALLAGEAQAIGPVGPHLAQAVFRHSPERYKLVSGPDPAHPVAVLDVSAYFVFRHASYEGDDTTRLASELAAFLAAASEQWLVTSLGLIPVREEGQATWAAAAPLDADSRTLLQRAAAAQAPYSLRGGLRLAELRAAVLPQWHAFWQQNTSPEQFAADVMAALQGALRSP